MFYYCHLNDQPKFEGQWKGYKQESELTFLFCYENEVQLIRQRSFSSWFFFPLIRFDQNETDFSVFHIHTRSTCWVFKMEVKSWIELCLHYIELWTFYLAYNTTTYALKLKCTIACRNSILKLGKHLKRINEYWTQFVFLLCLLNLNIFFVLSSNETDLMSNILIF